MLTESEDVVGKLKSTLRSSSASAEGAQIEDQCKTYPYHLQMSLR